MRIHVYITTLALAACGGGNGSGGDTADAGMTADADLGPATTVTAVVTGLPADPTALVGLVAMYQDGGGPWHAAPLSPSFTFDVHADHYGVGFACQGNGFEPREMELTYRALAEGDRVTLSVPFRCSQAGVTRTPVMGQVYDQDVGLSSGTAFRIRRQPAGRGFDVDPVPSTLVSVPFSFRVRAAVGTMGVVRRLSSGVDAALVVRGVDARASTTFDVSLADGVNTQTVMQSFPAAGPDELTRIDVAYATGSAPEQQFLLDSVTVADSPAVSRPIAFIPVAQQAAPDFHVITVTTLQQQRLAVASAETDNPVAVTVPTLGAPTETAARTAGTATIDATWTAQSTASYYRVALRQVDDTGGCSGDACLVLLAGDASPGYADAAGYAWRTPDVSQIPEFPAPLHSTKPITITIGAGSDNGQTAGSSRTTKFIGLQRSL